MRRSHYKTLEPVSEDRREELVAKASVKVAELRAEHREHRSTAASKVKEANKLEKNLSEIFKAVKAGEPVYELQNGTLTSEEPDAQLEI